MDKSDFLFFNKKQMLKLQKKRLKLLEKKEAARRKLKRQQKRLRLKKQREEIRKGIEYRKIIRRGRKAVKQREKYPKKINLHLYSMVMYLDMHELFQIPELESTKIPTEPKFALGRFRSHIIIYRISDGIPIVKFKNSAESVNIRLWLNHLNRGFRTNTVVKPYESVVKNMKQRLTAIKAIHYNSRLERLDAEKIKRHLKWYELPEDMRQERMDFLKAMSEVNKKTLELTPNDLKVQKRLKGHLENLGGPIKYTDKLNYINRRERKDDSSNSDS